MPVPSPASRFHDVSFDLAPRPGASDVARHLSLVVHDLRGPATALSAYARFLDDQSRASLDPVAASWLDGCQANGELAAHLCEALSVLEGSCVRSRAPLGLVVPAAAARLQKFLARAQVGLKVSGVFPDRQFERRRLGFVVEAVLVAVAHSVGAGRPSRVEFSAEAHEDRVTVRVACDEEAAVGLEGLVVRLREGEAGGLSEMALLAALIDLRAGVAVTAAGGFEIRLQAMDEVESFDVRGRDESLAVRRPARGAAVRATTGRVVSQST